MWQDIEALDSKVADSLQAEMIIELGRLGTRACTWFLRSRRLDEPMQQLVQRFKPAVEALRMRLAPDAGASQRATAWIQSGVPQEVAQSVAMADGLFAALDTAEIVEATQRTLDEVSEAHFGVGDRLGLAKLRQQINALPTDSYWQSLAKVALGDDLSGLQRSIAHDVVSHGEGSAVQMLAAWEGRNGAALERAQRMLVELGDAKAVDLAMLSVALRELRNLG
jgi:glutamate dehydrogenase